MTWQRISQKLHLCSSLEYYSIACMSLDIELYWKVRSMITLKKINGLIRYCSTIMNVLKTKILQRKRNLFTELRTEHTTNDWGHQICHKEPPLFRVSTIKKCRILKRRMNFLTYSTDYGSDVLFWPILSMLVIFLRK